MTHRQMYTCLAKIAGHKCYDGKKLLLTKRVGKDHLPIIQRRIMALLEKLDYDKTRHDFREVYLERPAPLSFHRGNAINGRTETSPTGIRLERRIIDELQRMPISTVIFESIRAMHDSEPSI